MTQDIQIRRRPDGSIDTAYYTTQARVQRSAQAHALIGTAAPKPKQKRAVFTLAGLIALIPFIGGQA